MEFAVLEPEGEFLGLRVPELEAPQYAPLERAAPQHEYQQPAGPRLGSKAEGEKIEPEAATDRW